MKEWIAFNLFIYHQKTANQKIRVGNVPDK